MRIALAQLAPHPGRLLENLETLRSTVVGLEAELVIFPELYLSGYRLGDGFHRLALDPEGEELRALGRFAAAQGKGIVVGAPLRHPRSGELVNGAVFADPAGAVRYRGKRFLPNYGPFEEAALFSPELSSKTVAFGERRVGLQICYDAFFPEVSRELALDGAELLVVISAAPITSRRLFDKVLPARAVENAVPLVYVNRTGVEDGLVFGGGSQAVDARGEPASGSKARAEEGRHLDAVEVVELDLDEAARWRPFRPVLRDVAASRRGTGPEVPRLPAQAPAFGTAPRAPSL
jgi:predicted amidohydrolase